MASDHGFLLGCSLEQPLFCIFGESMDETKRGDVTMIVLSWRQKGMLILLKSYVRYLLGFGG
jgi:hypothetical protein